LTTATARIRRRRYLGSYFEALAAFARNSADKGRPEPIPVGSHPISVEQWEWDALTEWARSRREEGWQFLLVEGLALEARCASDMQRASGGGAATAQGWESVYADLHFDAILGFRMMAEVQHAVERMVLRGRIVEAKRLTQFRQRIAATVNATGSFLGEARLREAEAMASVVADAPEPAAGTQEVNDPAPTGTELKALLELEEKLQKNAEIVEAQTADSGAPWAVATAEPERRLWPMRTVFAPVLAALVFVWLALVAWPALTREDLRAVTMADFEDTPAVRSVVARPPSLFVAVDDEKWRALSDEERRTVVERIARVIEPLGYTGAHFAGGGGGFLAQWLRRGGARLVDPQAPRL